MRALESLDRDRAATTAAGSRQAALLHALQVALSVAESLPADVELATWAVYPGVAEAHIVGGPNDDDLDRSRRVHEIALSVPGFAYRAEKRQLYTSIAAVRESDGVMVRIWDHIGAHRLPVVVSGVAA